MLEKTKKVRPVIVLSALVIFSACGKENGTRFHSPWKNSLDRVWAGPDFWANRLQDWRVIDGKLECLTPKPMRTVHLVTRYLAEAQGSLECRADIEWASDPAGQNQGSAGFLLGAGSNLDYRAAALIHHSYGKNAGLYAGIDARGILFLRDFEHQDVILDSMNTGLEGWRKVCLDCRLEPVDGGYVLKLSAEDSHGNRSAQMEHGPISGERLTGSLALVSHPGNDENASARFRFSEWILSGDKLARAPGRRIGPILSSQYTLSRGILKLTAQMMPLTPDDNSSVKLEILEGSKWIEAAETSLRFPGFTATFKVENWNRDEDVPYRVVYNLKSKNRNQVHYREGIIKRDPIDKPRLTMAAFACVHQVVKPERTKWSGVDHGTFPWDWGSWYPHKGLVGRITRHQPDVLFFSGDQIYEGASPTAADLKHPYLDYLYKWYMWCLSFRNLTSVIPAVTIPDDHDVYHGNLWGTGGKATDEGLTGAAAQDSGGYKMSPDFVNMVEQTQTSHLPDPYDPTPALNGIGVYYTECNIGGLSLAVIEDRKFKSAPKTLLPEAQIFNGWPQNPGFDPKTDARIDSASLVGDRQLDFLEHWASDWSGKTWMKAVLSQTIFINLATLPQDSKNDDVVPLLAIPEPGEYIRGEKIVSDFDSNGWPQPERDKVIRKMRKAFAMHIAGDQHLASTTHYGVDEFRDSVISLCTPAVGNIFPRRWFPPFPGKNATPGAPAYTGDFEDGFGNKMTVYAVANPRKTDRFPSRLHELATGYAVITFDRTSREIELAIWPYWAEPGVDAPFDGWPLTFHQSDNYARKAEAWLPQLHISGIENPVIQVINEAGGEIEYTLRIKGNLYQPKVFHSGTYSVKIGDPDLNLEKTIPGLIAGTKEESGSLEIVF